MKILHYPFMMAGTLVTLVCWLACSLGGQAETNTVLTAAKPKVEKFGLAEQKAANRSSGQTRIAVPVHAGAGEATLFAHPKIANLGTVVHEQPSVGTKTRNVKLQNLPAPGSEISGRLTEQIDAIQRARAEIALRRTRAEDAREELRASLRVNRAALVQNRREAMVDAKQRAQELQTKLIEQKELLDETALISKGRNRRGTD